MFLQEFDYELPPCFKAWCDCGWRGKLADGYCWVIGQNTSMDDAPLYGPTCPGCKCHARHSIKFHRSEHLEDFQSRLRWIMDMRGSFLERGGDLFPCSCQVKPNCRIVGQAIPFVPTLNDVFISDGTWVRLWSKIECNGCQAKTMVAWLEKFNNSDIYRGWPECWLAKAKSGSPNYDEL